ncbi:uncharacterized protein GGS22DRAFT_192217 [Annulohypoxylon maeteangense]|uniref:uncharacterized protein n=1 Tax=Annulohypoxylon maeteangense TaxID=1927788 RepID=UPI0020079674|nr:uncharacterized protein GGS22DRAFT_192217 [Annulohypoxylon maeteangense]KAI0881582.1 hypothetical protein GGS22DRAFT_192217 [Annulohypoxylon maeteangense]
MVTSFSGREHTGWRCCAPRFQKEPAIERFFKRFFELFPSMTPIINAFYMALSYYWGSANGLALLALFATGWSHVVIVIAVRLSWSDPSGPYAEEGECLVDYRPTL